MLSDGRIAARLPATDLDRARAFYSEKLGLDPSEERPGGLRYQLGSGEFSLAARTTSEAWAEGTSSTAARARI